MRGSCNTSGSLSAELYDVPVAPTSFSGRLTWRDQWNAGAELAFTTDRRGRYPGRLTLTQDSVVVAPRLELA